MEGGGRLVTGGELAVTGGDTTAPS